MFPAYAGLILRDGKSRNTFSYVPRMCGVVPSFCRAYFICVFLFCVPSCCLTCRGACRHRAARPTASSCLLLLFGFGFVCVPSVPAAMPSVALRSCRPLPKRLRAAATVGRVRSGVPPRSRACRSLGRSLRSCSRGAVPSRVAYRSLACRWHSDTW